MKPDDRFWRTLIECSERKTRDDAFREWRRIRLMYCGDPFFDQNYPPECICGKKHIVDVHVFQNEITQNIIFVGSCCVRRWGFAVPSWRSKLNYLKNALDMARTDWERSFVADLKRIREQYGRLSITPKQKAVLERITGRKFRCKLYDISLLSHRHGRPNEHGAFEGQT